MDSIGAEVGQKMRSAIKAKLMELNCYVDDELPDYIMVMVANKRTKSQMNEDLQLFLNDKTSSFVEWLHIVLKKLKEVTVTNPDVYKKVASKRALDVSPSVNQKIKKEKKDKTKSKKSQKKDTSESVIAKAAESKSLTDDLPISASTLSERRKIVIMQDSQSVCSNGGQQNSNDEVLDENSFDIPPLSAVNLCSEGELQDIEQKIKSVKNRLGLLVDSDSEADILNLKTELDDLLSSENLETSKENVTSFKTSGRRAHIVSSDKSSEADCSVTSSQKPSRTQIIFNNGANSANKRKSVHERLGKRALDREEHNKKKQIIISHVRRGDERILSSRKEETSSKRIDMISTNDRPRESALNRLGVMSKVSVPVKNQQEEEKEEEVLNKEVPSVIKVKPRTIPPNVKQANKNLLLKAVAEAQKSLASAPSVGNSIKPDALFTKKYKEKQMSSSTVPRKIPNEEKQKLRNLVVEVASQQNDKYSVTDDDENLEYVPKPIKRKSEIGLDTEYVPSSKLTKDCDSTSPTDTSVKQRFIITLDGIKRTQFKDQKDEPEIKCKRSHSPIVFDKTEPTVSLSTRNIPDELPVPRTPLVKHKERCKYWPICKQGESCDFTHPSAMCKIFPQCKFGDRCLYIHPSCKFENSCTKRDCPYSHAGKPVPKAPRNTASAPLATQTCKFFPNCTKAHCAFYHPRPCKFGKYCKNQAECSFSHAYPANKSSLKWQSPFKT